MTLVLVGLACLFIGASLGLLIGGLMAAAGRGEE
jgi:hypothetical protein